jgi:hypothetical protein
MDSNLPPPAWKPALEADSRIAWLVLAMAVATLGMVAFSL